MVDHSTVYNRPLQYLSPSVAFSFAWPRTAWTATRPFPLLPPWGVSAKHLRTLRTCNHVEAYVFVSVHVYIDRCTDCFNMCIDVYWCGFVQVKRRRSTELHRAKDLINIITKVQAQGNGSARTRTSKRSCRSATRLSKRSSVTARRLTTASARSRRRWPKTTARSAFMAQFHTADGQSAQRLWPTTALRCTWPTTVLCMAKHHTMHAWL